MSFSVKGWCPGALRPMQSGDGLVVRVRPVAGRLTQVQAAGIAQAARAHGNGLIDLSGRANVQLRGVTPESHPALIADLAQLGLIDPDIATEARRNIIVTPFANAATYALAESLQAALAAGPELPGKFGFLLDCGSAPVMADTQADIRFERAPDGQLLLRCAGCDLGAPVTEGRAAEAALDLAEWFVRAGGVVDGRGRMSRLIGSGVSPEGTLRPLIAPATALSRPEPGLTVQGALVGLAFGQMHAETLAALASLGPIRVTPWRMLLIEGLSTLPGLPDLITEAGDPRLRVFACTGAPGCPQAARPTREIARVLAPRVAAGQTLHVSGCAKGCAWPAPADLTLIATLEGFDLVRDGRTSDHPAYTRISPAALPDLPEFS
ncbi:precorrin-3B synthase [Thioclava sp. L04-15]|uniref:precorrin-3B synthase n=1 Tax=Thioclava sp. L04-15 TaxID=1915318 RepID=UPI000998843E|nr:precorrin-3B synthase [Thioclava sp. L04-15]OOY28217.1 precorrin-3B synthase [Thioclava sp. L04-15]TNE90302.1 MAG: precorrin-3B synthase [Paracoccaceae bacterium]